MADRPSGTVTFLFSDIEGSTRLLDDVGAEQYRSLLDEHQQLMRFAMAAHAGSEVDTQGDAFFVAFHRAGDAVRAATDAQRALAVHGWSQGVRVRVRMGIHTAEATPTEGSYVGIGVHRGARICAAGHGGQVLLSRTTTDLLEGDELRAALIDLGDHRLKDLTEPQRLFQLVVPGLNDVFPPLRTLENRPTNLPTQATLLVGREREVDEIGTLLSRDDVRLVTLTGAGGSGKTRLALQAAAEQLEGFSDGVFFVGLASIADPTLVTSTIAQALTVNEGAGQSLAAFLAPKEMLLVVDNFEHLMSAAPQLASLLTAAPRVKALATSREPLHVAAEHAYPVPPLALPDLRRLPEASALMRYEAVALFVERAQAALPSFSVTHDNASAVAEMCVRLDGLPLAIELAAARVPVLSPETMLKRLGERLKLLTTGPRDQPSRHQTLRNTLAWSHDLLTDEERSLFARLAVFAGGFSLEAAEVVCDADLDVLASLVDKSLVRRDGERFAMLDTIREFATEQLGAGETGGVRDRHAAFFEALAEDAYLERHANQQARSAELEREHDNIRAALDWLKAADQGRYLRLAGALGWFWHVHSHLSEGRRRLADALTGTSGGGADRARAVAAAGELAAWQGDLPAAERLTEEAVSAWRALGREQDAALALHELGWGHLLGGRDDTAARRCMEESLAIQRSLGDPLLINRAQLGLLQVLVAIGDLEPVKRLGPEALDLAQRLGDVWYEHFAHHFLGDCALIEGDFAGAQDRYRRSLDVAWRSGDQVESCYELQGMAMAAAGLGQADRALKLAGAAEAHLRALGIDDTMGFWAALLDTHIGKARAQLGNGATGAWDAGQRLGFDRAVDEALAERQSVEV